MILQSPEFFWQFTMVIATGLNEACSLALSKAVWQHNIPLILVRSVGFLGSLRIVMREIARPSLLRCPF
jgi:amyloid beta precursor protein binding protein 1